jgi:alkylation response protein AidB-like acyl-CoA dehydrogenase
VDFDYSDDQRALRDLARQILCDRVTHDRLKQLDDDPDRFDRDVWSELAKANLLGASLPESVGGSGLGLIETCLLLQEVARAVAPVPAHATLLLAALPIAELGSDAQRAALLPGVALGKIVLSGALAEPGGDPRRPLLRATRDAVGWCLDGSKSFVPAVHLAERLLVTARTGEASAGLFLLDPRAPGVTAERQQTTSGEPQFALEIRNVPVAADDVLGDPLAGFDAVDWVVDRAIVGNVAMQLGATERMLEMTAEYGRERQQFDRPIGSFQAYHQRAADAYINVEALRLAVLEATWRLDRGLPAREALQIAKFWAGAPAYRTGFACSHLHGGIGSDTDYPLHRYYLWIKQLELQLGSGTEALVELGAGLAEAP